MLRSIFSSTQVSDLHKVLDGDLIEEALRDTYNNARDFLRETWREDENEEPLEIYRVLPYATPNGENRFAVLADDFHGDVSNWYDTDDYEEAVTLYEKTVREAAAHGHTYGATDVPGVNGYEDGSEQQGNAEGRALAAEWLDEAYASAMEAVKVLEGRRRVAIARAVDTHGRGGQTVLARRLGIKQPTVQELAMRGRADMMRAEKSAS